MFAQGGTTMSSELIIWYQLLSTFRSPCTRPGWDRLAQLLTAWVLCPGRHTVTRLWGVMDPNGRLRYEAYAWFLRKGRWHGATVWRLWVRFLVQTVKGVRNQYGELWLLLDDTLFHKTGRKVAGAGIFRDALQSTGVRTVTAWGLNVVVLAVYVTPPWGGEPWALPVNLRIHRKGGPTLLDLAEAMVREVAEWLPEERFALVADGAYTALARRGMPRTVLYSRMRRNAALYQAPPVRKKGQRGRPRKRGDRLPTPEQWAKNLPASQWQRATVDIRGRKVERLVFAQQVLWYETCPDQLVLMVLVRDPAGVEPDDFFFTTDLTATAASVLEHYGGRWTIEETFRATKQHLGGEDPQSWVEPAPERAVTAAFLTYGLVWVWYLLTQGDHPKMISRPWYPKKTTPSFLDALATLRTVVWTDRIYDETGPRRISSEMAAQLIQVLAEAG